MSTAPAVEIPSEALEVLAFWQSAGRDRWFGKDEAFDREISDRFKALHRAAAAGDKDRWAETAEGALALIIVLDQFSRNIFRATPDAFAQDPKALGLALEGLENGHYAALSTPWEQTTYQLSLTHCEGPDHLARLDRAHALAQEILASAPDHLRPIYAFAVEQKVLHRRVIAAFGRFPHRNAALGRTSTPEEAAYVAGGEFPHRRPLPQGHSPESGSSA